MKFFRKPTHEVFHITFVLMALFLVTFILPNFFPKTHEILAFQSLAVLEGSWWQLLTYVFVHLTALGLLGNVLVLFFFGLSLENHWGSWETGLFFLLMTLGVSGAALGISQITGQPAVLFGANALGYGVMIAWAAYNPNQPIYLMGIIAIKAKWLVLGYIALFSVLAFMDSGPYASANILGAIIAAVYMGLRHRINIIQAFFGSR